MMDCPVIPVATLRFIPLDPGEVEGKQMCMYMYDDNYMYNNNLITCIIIIIIIMIIIILVYD